MMNYDDLIVCTKCWIAYSRKQIRKHKCENQHRR